MSDIVERLQGENWWLNVDGNEAADEIKRLLAEINCIHAHLAHYRTLVDGLRAEIKQLRRALGEKT
jgi:hypothetical protein